MQSFVSVFPPKQFVSRLLWMVLHCKYIINNYGVNNTKSIVKPLSMAKHSVTFAYLSIGHIILQGSHDFCLYVLFVTVTGLAVLILIQFPARWFRCSCNLCKYTWSTATIINGCLPLLLTFKSSLTVENNRDQPVARQCWV